MRAYEVFTAETGWVPVVGDSRDKLLLWVAVRGYTFYAVRYADVTSVREAEE